MDIVKKYLSNGQYLTQEYDKVSMFLHHTISTNAMSSWRWWNSTPDRVGTPYIIDRDGSIIECFNPAMWAFHLGIMGDDNYHEKHSINIELVSAGPLRYEDGKFIFYPLWPNKIRWTEIPKSEVHSFSKPWMGFEHWHKYTDDQLESLKWLIGRIALDFPTIGLENDLKSIFEYNPKVVEEHLEGIWTHCTVRKDKSDAFPDPALIEALLEVQGELVTVKKATEIEEVTIIPKTIKKPSKSKKTKADDGPQS